MHGIESLKMVHPIIGGITMTYGVREMGMSHGWIYHETERHKRVPKRWREVQVRQAIEISAVGMSFILVSLGQPLHICVSCLMLSVSLGHCFGVLHHLGRLNHFIVWSYSSYIEKDTLLYFLIYCSLNDMSLHFSTSSCVNSIPQRCSHQASPLTQTLLLKFYKRMHFDTHG